MDFQGWLAPLIHPRSPRLPVGKGNVTARRHSRRPNHHRPPFRIPSLSTAARPEAGAVRSVCTLLCRHRDPFCLAVPRSSSLTDMSRVWSVAHLDPLLAVLIMGAWISPSL